MLQMLLNLLQIGDTTVNGNRQMRIITLLADRPVHSPAAEFHGFLSGLNHFNHACARARQRYRNPNFVPFR